MSFNNNQYNINNTSLKSTIKLNSSVNLPFELTNEDLRILSLIRGVQAFPLKCSIRKCISWRTPYTNSRFCHFHKYHEKFYK